MSRYSFAVSAYLTGSAVCQRENVEVVTTQSPLDDGLAGYVLSHRYDTVFLPDLRPANLDDPDWLQEQLINHLQRYVGKWLLRQADAVRVTNQRGHDWCTNSLNIPDERVYLNYTPITMIEQTPASAQLETDPSEILFVGRLTAVKRVQDLLNAFKTVVDSYPHASLTIVGDGPERTELEELSRDLSLSDSVEFAGAVNYDEINQYYSAAGLLVLPSSRETFGRVIIEAFAHRTPVIATATQGATETIEPDETGLLVPRHEPDELADAILSLLEDPEKSERMGVNAQDFASERFDPESLTERIVDTWVEVGRRSAN